MSTNPTQALRSDFTPARAEPFEAVRVLRALSARYSRHDFIGNPKVLAWLLNRPPTTFEHFVRTQYAAFKAGSPVGIVYA